MAWDRTNPYHDLTLHNPLMLSLPINDALKSLLTSLSTRLTHRYFVTRVVQCSESPDSDIVPYFFDIVKPFVWHRNESAGSASEERSGDELRAETESGQSDEG